MEEVEALITIALTGDVMLGRGVNEDLKTMAAEEPWGDTLPLLCGADLRLINLECAITGEEAQPWRRTPKTFHFRADPEETIATLGAADIDACSLANNHTLDFEEQGLVDTLGHLDAAGIGYAGAGANSGEAFRPLHLRGGVALVAFTDNSPEFAASIHRSGTNYLPVSLEEEILGKVEEAIGAARDAGAETVVFSNHWGPNMVARPPEHFRRFARAVIDRGADLYYGHSSHVFQAVEIYRGKPILYDTGDFIDDYAVDPRLRNDRSFVFTASFEGREFVGLELVPVSLSYAHVGLVAGEEREAILKRMGLLCFEMGTTTSRREGALVVEAG